MKRLGVNIDHIATLRNVRGENHPNVYDAAKFVINRGADSITIHLREDRRHIIDEDLKRISSNTSIPLNLEIAANEEMLKIALKNKPNFVCLVPEKRNELTTEGGLNIKKNQFKLKKIIQALNKKKIRTSLFINPNFQDIRKTKFLGANCIEIHTGKISRMLKNKKNYKNEYNKIVKCSKLANELGLEVHAGHGMDYKTAKILSKIKEIKEFNIGHFIIGESIFYGISKVIKKFKKIAK